jgi:hypothetical protein
MSVLGSRMFMYGERPYTITIDLAWSNGSEALERPYEVSHLARNQTEWYLQRRRGISIAEDLFFQCVEALTGP